VRTIAIAVRHSDLDPGTVLFGKTRRRVLGLLFGQPDESFYVRDIVRRSGAAVGAIARELDALLGAGLLERYEDGRHVYYRANKRAPVFPELERLVTKTLTLGDAFREALSPMAEGIEFAAIFGPAARGQMKATRPNHFVVIGDVRPGEVTRALAKVPERLDAPVKQTVSSLADLRKKIADNPAFFSSLFGDFPLFVIGDPDDFRRLGALRWSKRRA